MKAEERKGAGAWLSDHSGAAHQQRRFRSGSAAQLRRWRSCPPISPLSLLPQQPMVTRCGTPTTQSLKPKHDGRRTVTGLRLAE